MTKQIKTEVVINAMPEKVRATLTSFDDYKNRNPYIKSSKKVIFILTTKN